MRSGRLSDILIRRNLLTADALKTSEDHARSEGVRLEKYLVDKKVVPDVEMTLAISEYLDMRPISLLHFTPDVQLIDRVDRAVLKKHVVLPIAMSSGSITVAFADPFDMIAVDDVQTSSGMDIIPVVAPEKEIQDILDRAFHEESKPADMEEILKQADPDLEVGHEKEDDQDDSLEMALESVGTAPVIRMVNIILVEALRTGASDIHLEPQEKTLRLRYRIDGSLLESSSPPKTLQGAVISRMKLMSGMDIAERRIPQDGRIKIRALGKEVDLRVNTLPTIFGEKIVMRILDKTSLFPNLAALGLDDVAYRAMKHSISQPHGIILVTGPTGSGKTTTLYSCLLELNKPDVNIVTCEDPVEYQLEGINQVQINSFVGLTFSAALRSVLRQSPDIILVGETRDGETAEIAIKAALTGHLVLSTLHTNDAAGAITRLVDMGVEPSLLASSLVLAQAQRLMRKLCPACKRETKEIPLKRLEAYGIAQDFFKDATVYEAVGCSKCHNSGYKGRLALMEVLTVDKDIRRDILRGVSSKEIATKAKSKGMVMLKDTGLQKVLSGITSIDAALEVTGGD